MRMLIADDDVVTRTRLERLLTAWGHEVIAVGDGLAAWDVLQRDDAPHLVLLDWLMPGMNGVELCRKIRQESASQFAYIVLLTGKAAKQDVAEGIDAGADDYLSKPFDQQDLKVRLRAAQRIVEFHETLLNQATHDALTGLWNRKAILDILQKELARGIRNDTPVGVIMGDIDHFKRINDTHGHPGGDAVLCDVSTRLAAALRPSDSLGRYGGEEFLMILPGCDSESTLAVAERMLAAIADAAAAVESQRVLVTLSLGIAASSRRWLNAGELVKLADGAMYRAKQGGRNRVELYAELQTVAAS